MKHVSWVLALVVGGVIGWFLHASVAGRATPSRPQPSAQVRPSRPVEDPKAVYRVPVEDSPTKGPADALVTIVESSDFECPFCRRVLPTLKQIEEAYPGKVRFVWKHNPLSFHARALPAAIAAEEARAQGGDAKFWAMHDALFASAPALGDEDIVRAAGQVGLDVAKVREALAGRRHVERIERDQRLVTSLGATGTPAFFVNGRKVTGAVPFERFKAVIDEELAKAEAMVRSGTAPGQVYARIAERGATAPVFLPGPAAPPSEPAAAPAAPPRPPPSTYRKVEVRADDPAKGARNAKLTIVLFSDFECPFCARVEPTLKRIEEEKRGDVRIVWKHQPLAMHQNALPAALAAEAAREQGKFWEMHERLFANQRDLNPAAFERYARELKLDLARFKRAMESPKAKERVQEDQRIAASVGATGTPTMFFNCRQVVGAQPFERMMPVVEEEIRKVDALLASGARRDASLYGRACEANLAAAPAAAAPEPAGAPSPALPAANVTLRPDDPVRGAPGAPVTIALFSDFQCPFCARVEPSLARLEREYRGRVKIAWKHQPLVQIHPHAVPAALAAEAAREQGKFWEMHDKLFENQAALASAPYERLAREIGLDVARFKRAYDSGKYRSRIEEDQRLAASLGIGGTPTLVVNGERVVGAQPYEQIKAVVDRKLAETARR